MKSIIQSLLLPILDSDLDIMKSNARYELNQTIFNSGKNLSSLDIFIPKTEPLTKGAIEGEIGEIDSFTSSELHKQADKILRNLGCQTSQYTDV